MQSLATNSSNTKPIITTSNIPEETPRLRNQPAKASLSLPRKAKAMESMLPLTATLMQPTSTRVTIPIVMQTILAKTSTLTSQESLQATSIEENTRLKSRHQMKCGMNSPNNLMLSSRSQAKLAKLNIRSQCINLSSSPQITTTLRTKDTKSCQMAQHRGHSCTPQTAKFLDPRKNATVRI